MLYFIVYFIYTRFNMETIETFNMPEEIRTICGKRKIQFKELAKLSGQTSQNLYNKMNRTDWKLTEMKRVLDVLDADLCLQIVDRKTGKPFFAEAKPPKKADGWVKDGLPSENEFVLTFSETHGLEIARRENEDMWVTKDNRSIFARHIIAWRELPRLPQ